MCLFYCLFSSIDFIISIYIIFCMWIPSKNKKITFSINHPEFTKERIYGSITLLATAIALFIHFDDETTAKVVLFSIVATTVGIWLAAIFSEIIAEKLAENLTHWVNTFTYHDKKEIMFNSLWILYSSVFPLVLSVLAFIKLISVHSALIAMIGMLILQLLFFILLATLHHKNSLLVNIVLLWVQLFFFILIILLKLSH